MKPHLLLWLLSLIIFISAAAAQPVDENALFSDTSSIIDSATVVDNQSMQETADKKSVGISGSIMSAAIGSVIRGFKDDPGFAHTGFSSFITGDLNLDARLTRGFKAFGTAEVQYWPVVGGTIPKDSLRFALPELFVDANIGRMVYLRTGKQVLQWGRCNFWNPTDLINIEKKPFIEKIGAREGTYGVKMHVPFGTMANLYGWAGTRATRVDSIAGALKVEWLLGNTEMALGIWGKRSFMPVYSYDISSRLFGIDISGEIGLYQEFQGKKPVFVNGVPTVEIVKEDWIPRVCLGLSKSFDVLEVQDRLNVIGEFYYNQAGNTDRAINIMDPGIEYAPGAENEIRMQILQLLVAQGFYEPNSYSRFYGAFFASLSRFIIQDLTLTLNAIGNMNQQCAIISTGLSYMNLSDFNLGLSVNSFIGNDNTEYTIIGNAVQVQLTAGVTF